VFNPIKKALDGLNNATVTYKVHAIAAVSWMLLVIPSWFFWRNSIFWVCFISLYANFVSHWGAWQAVRAELVADQAEKKAQHVAEILHEEAATKGQEELELLRHIERAVERGIDAAED
jgi:hypothetical protein